MASFTMTLGASAAGMQNELQAVQSPYRVMTNGAAAQEQEEVIWVYDAAGEPGTSGAVRQLLVSAPALCPPCQKTKNPITQHVNQSQHLKTNLHGDGITRGTTICRGRIVNIGYTRRSTGKLSLSLLV